MSLSRDYGSIFDRLEARLADRVAELAAERADLPGLIAELDRLPPDRRPLLIANSRRFHHWTLAVALADECETQASFEADRALERGRLAVAVAEALDPERYGRALVHDLAARAWVQLGQALCSTGDLTAAEAAFESAGSHLDRGTGDTAEESRLAWQEASLRIAQHRYDRAFEILDRVLQSARDEGETHLLGKALWSKGVCYARAGEPEAAIGLLEEALSQIDPAIEPRVALAAAHDLASALVEAGRTDEAGEHLERARELSRKIGGRRGPDPPTGVGEQALATHAPDTPDTPGMATVPERRPGGGDPVRLLTPAPALDAEAGGGEAGGLREEGRRP